MKKYLIISVLAAVLALLGSGVALAATGGTIPHGGYSPATDACLQCHDIHESASDYVLMRWPTVTDTCGTCHTLFQQPPASGVPGTPSWNGDVRGSVSGVAIAGGPVRALGEIEDPITPTSPGPILDGADKMGPTGAPRPLQDMNGDTLPDYPDPDGRYFIGDRVNYYPGQDWRGTGPIGFAGAEASIPWFNIDPWDYTEDEAEMPEHRYGSYSPGTGSPYEAYQVKSDGSDGRGGKLGHRGHRLGNLGERGGLGAVKNNIIGGKAGYSAIKQWEWPLTVPSTTYAATSGLYCASCHTPHGTFGKMLPTSVSNKLLSAQPNHTIPDLQINNWNTEGGRWCGRCHDKRTKFDDNGNFTGYHNHPDNACLSCHGNYVGSGDPTRYTWERGDVDPSAGYSAQVRNEKDDPLDVDFPHTGDIPKLLTLEPDELCILCHAKGMLP